MSLDARHRRSLKGFLFKTDKVPTLLLSREMKISEPVVVGAPWKLNSLAPRYRDECGCFIYYLPKSISKHYLLGIGKKH